MQVSEIIQSELSTGLGFIKVFYFQSRSRKQRVSIWSRSNVYSTLLFIKQKVEIPSRSRKLTEVDQNKVEFSVNATRIRLNLVIFQSTSVVLFQLTRCKTLTKQNILRSRRPLNHLYFYFLILVYFTFQLQFYEQQKWKDIYSNQKYFYFFLHSSLLYKVEILYEYHPSNQVNGIMFLPVTEVMKQSIP